MDAAAAPSADERRSDDASDAEAGAEAEAAAEGQIDAFLHGRRRSEPSSKQQAAAVSAFYAGLRSHVASQVGLLLGGASEKERAALLEAGARDFPFLREVDWDDVPLGGAKRARGEKSVAGRRGKGAVAGTDEGDASGGHDPSTPATEAKGGSRKRGRTPRTPAPRVPLEHPPFELSEAREKNAGGNYKCMARECEKSAQADTGVDGTYRAQLCRGHYRIWTDVARAEGGDVDAPVGAAEARAKRRRRGRRSGDGTGGGDGPSSAPRPSRGDATKPKSFEERLEQCRAFAKERGHLNITREAGAEDLASWAEKMQEDYRKFFDGLSDPEGRDGPIFHRCEGSMGTIGNRLEALEEMGFPFEPAEQTSEEVVRDGGASSATAIWEWRLEQCRRFQEEHGHLNFPVKRRDMQPWVERMRTLYQRRVEGGQEALTIAEQAKIARLEEMGFAFDGVFDVNLQKLTKFKAETGHCRVPVKHDPDRALGHWAEMVRREHNRLNRGETSKYLTMDRLRKLNNVGFTWQLRENKEVPWEENFQKLKAYREEHGRDLPTSCTGIGAWILKQRCYYNKKVDGIAKHGLPDEREEKLRGIGFVFQAGKRPTAEMLASNREKRATWDERLAEFVRWKEHHGHPYVPTMAPGPDRLLGRWVAAQRMAYKAYRQGKKNPKYGTLTADKALKLANAGFAFDASHIHKTPKEEEDGAPAEGTLMEATNGFDPEQEVPAVPGWRTTGAFCNAASL
ncbi:hypothetical protein ACHAWF_006097 [Thalassiosira exigua]